jgi:hypothetical protein
MMMIRPSLNPMMRSPVSVGATPVMPNPLMQMGGSPAGAGLGQQAPAMPVANIQGPVGRFA